MAPRRKQHGTVLITVVMMVAIAAIIVTDMTYRQKLDIKRTSALLSRDQAFQYLISAEELANFVLVDDLKADNNKNDPIIVDTLYENWAKESSPFIVAGGFIQGRIYDLQGRFNINSLMASDTQVRDVQRDRFRSLLGSLGIPKETNSQVTPAILTERLVDWMDANQDPTGFDGMEDLDYLARFPPHRAANSVMWDVSELMLIEGFTPQDLAVLSDWICILPPDVALNVNTADPRILEAYFSGISAGMGLKIKQGREDASNETTHHEGGFKDLQAFQDFMMTQGVGADGNVNQGATVGSTSGDPGDPDPGNGIQQNNQNTGQQQQNNKMEGNFDVKSEYYLLEAEAVINDKPVLMRAILYRPTITSGGSNDEITIKTLSRKLEDPLKRV